jgi:FkbM family methyltransferase
MRFSFGFQSRLARNGGAYCLRTLKPSARAEILDALAEEMVSIIPIDGTQIVMYTPSPGLIFRANSLLTKETDTIEWIRRFDDDAVFWDIGANVGVYSLYAAVSRRSLTLAFEPAPANFYALRRNIQLNCQDEHIHPYCIAFASRTKLGVVNLESEAMGAASSQFGKVGDRSRYSSSSQSTSHHSTLGFSIDDFIRQFCPPFPNHIKLDVDGIEWEILSGAKATLADARLRSILVELSVTETKETEYAVKILNEAGFELQSLGETQGLGKHRAANHIFQRLQESRKTGSF